MEVYVIYRLHLCRSDSVSFVICAKVKFVGKHSYFAMIYIYTGQNSEIVFFGIISVESDES
jgi:hypothetical protein